MMRERVRCGTLYLEFLTIVTFINNISRHRREGMNRWIMYDNIKPQMKIVADRGLVSRGL